MDFDYLVRKTEKRHHRAMVSMLRKHLGLQNGLDSVLAIALFRLMAMVC